MTDVKTAEKRLSMFSAVKAFPVHTSATRGTRGNQTNQLNRFLHQTVHGDIQVTTSN